jgi:two-component sensor histidine kinase
MNVVNDAASRRIIEIVSNLRRFARLDESEWKQADLREGLDETLALVEHQTRGRIEVVRSYGEVPLVGCYPGQLNQVFMNLIVNAIQAIEGEGRIDVECLREGDSVVVRVRDDGHGIREEALSRIFDPGYTTKGVGVGTGLGLSIAYRIASNHGGTLRVKSEVGKGSEFTLSIPIGLAPPKTLSTTSAYTLSGYKMGSLLGYFFFRRRTCSMGRRRGMGGILTSRGRSSEPDPSDSESSLEVGRFMEVLGRDSAGWHDDALPGDVAGTLVHGPSDGPGREWPVQNQSGSVRPALHPSARYPTDDPVNLVPGARPLHVRSEARFMKGGAGERSGRAGDAQSREPTAAKGDPKTSGDRGASPDPGVREPLKPDSGLPRGVLSVRRALAATKQLTRARGERERRSETRSPGRQRTRGSRRRREGRPPLQSSARGRGDRRASRRRARTRTCRKCGGHHHSDGMEAVTPFGCGSGSWS